MTARDRRQPPLLLLGLDGATFSVIEPLTQAGQLPNLARWMQEGTARPLLSTTPPMSFPAWSSLQTGLAPGEHGLFDFTQKIAGAYRLRFTNAADRRGTSLFARVSRAGGRVLALGMPATFPPEAVNGLLVPGFDSPLSAGSRSDFASDPALYRRIAAKIGPWMSPDLNESARGDEWRERAVATLLARIERKTAFALEALSQLVQRDGTAPDLISIVFSESDTIAHHYWRDFDSHSPRRDPAASAERRGAVAAVYRALDVACGALRAAVGANAACVVVSDHGAGGASRRVLHVNRYLEQLGFLARRRAIAQLPERWIRRLRERVLAHLPPVATQALFRRARGAAARLESCARFSGFDWSRSFAFSEEANTQPGVWINLRGREAEGSVAPDDYERVRGEVIDALRDWKLPGGAPIIAWARRREEVYAGPCVECAPDVVCELALEDGYAHSLVPTPWRASTSPAIHTLCEEEFAGGRGRGMNGTHRPEGVWIAADTETAKLPPPRDLTEVAPLLLTRCGISWQADDGAAKNRDARPYTAEEAARVRERLRALGYLE